MGFRTGKALAIFFFIFSSCTLFSAVVGNVGFGYRLRSISSKGGEDVMVANLEAIKPTETYGSDIRDLRLTVRYENPDRLHVKITDGGNKGRWEIPQSLIPRGDDDPDVLKLNTGSFASPNLRFSYTRDPFGFAVSRRSTGEVLFNSTPPADGAGDGFGGLIFKDQYLELSTQIPHEASLYGLGESTRPDGLRLTHGTTYTLWAADIPSMTVDVDLYGAFPFYMDVRDGGVAHGVLLLNSNGMDIVYGDDSLTYKVIGGVLDFYFFAGPTPLWVISQYTELVGRPAPMPYWSFGFHQCKYGYRNVDELENVVARYKEADIPLEVMWTDIDYMDGWRDFTVDPVNFPQHRLRKFVDKLHQDGQKYVIIVDPGIKTDSNYSTFVRGLEADVYVKNWEGGENYLAQVWPGPVYFPDFLNPDTQAYWTREIGEFEQRIPFDGLWIDMNEASNFCSGVMCTIPAGNNKPCPDPNAQTTCCLECSSSSQATRWDDPPYKINYGGSRWDLGKNTMATSARHHDGVLEYDAHNLYGLSEAMVTERSLRDVLHRRPFVLSRSTFVGSGKYAAHWTGDNAASFKDLAYSVVGILNSGMFGIPMVGADICGFLGNTTEELCNRWIQLGAFYPFSRNHASLDSNNQELYVWDTVAASARAALGLRYRLLPFLYTLSFHAHMSGHPIARPLFFHFPQDAVTLGIHTQFLLGSSILVSPVLEQGARSVDAYFPKGTWYNLFDFTHITAGVNGSHHLLPAPLEVVNAHLHQGSIIPLQETRPTTTSARTTPFTLLLAFSLEEDMEFRSQSAHGELFLDGGEELEMALVPGKSTLVHFQGRVLSQPSSAAGSVKAAVGSYGEYASQQGWRVQSVIMLGLRVQPSNLLVNGAAPSSTVLITFDPATLRTAITGLDLSLGKDFDITWSA